MNLLIFEPFMYATKLISDTLLVIDLNFPTKEKLIDSSNRPVRPILEGIRGLAESNNIVEKVCFDNFGNLHRNLVKTYQQLSEAAENREENWDRILRLIGELGYQSVSLRLVERLIEIDSRIQRRLLEDYETHYRSLGVSFSSYGFPKPRTALNEEHVKLSSSDFKSFVTPHLKAYTHGNGFASDPFIVSTSYDWGATYFMSLLLSLRSLYEKNFQS